MSDERNKITHFQNQTVVKNTRNKPQNKVMKMENFKIYSILYKLKVTFLLADLAALALSSGVAWRPKEKTLPLMVMGIRRSGFSSL